MAKNIHEAETIRPLQGRKIEAECDGSYSILIEDPRDSFVDPLDDTSPINQVMIMGGQVMSLFDSLSLEEKQWLIELLTAWGRLSTDEKRLIVSAAEKFAGL